MSCRICNGNLEVVLDLGELYPSNFVSSDDNSWKAPLTLAQCRVCGLVQLKENVSLDSMYRQYWYKSGLNSSMVNSLKDIVFNIQKYIELKENDVVIDIGCNDGTMLGMFPDFTYRIGFEPALNLAEEASKNCDKLISDYFDSKYLYDGNNAKVITAIAMFYDLEDPVEFVSDVASILDKDGIFVIQLTDLMAMLNLNAFDNICHEHLEYYSLQVLIDLLYNANLEVFDVDTNDVNGGSIRIFSGFTGEHEVSSRVYNFLVEESKVLADKPFEKFAQRVQRQKEKLLKYIELNPESSFGVLGASTKGNTLLQYYGLDSNIISYAFEINPDKYGLKTVGTDILIVPDEILDDIKPDHLIVLPWHFVNNFVIKYNRYLEKGGKLIFPLPIARMVEIEGEYFKWTYL